VLFSQDDTAIEKTNVESLLAKNIKVLIICPNDGAAAAAAVEKARLAGVKVIAYDRLIMNTAAVDFYVTFDNFSVGRAQGQYLIDHATGSGNPLYLYAGSVTDNNAFQFFEGTWNVLQPKIADGTFVIENSSAAVALKDHAALTHAEQEAIFAQIAIADWNPDNARNMAIDNLAAIGAGGKGSVFILAPNDDTARSIAYVFAADSDVTSYVITGQDAEKASVQYIIDGNQSMTVFKDVRTLVDDAVAEAKTFLALGTPVPTTTYNNGTIDVPADPTAIVTVDKTNIKAALIDSGYYNICDFAGLDSGCPNKDVGIILPGENGRWLQDKTRFEDALTTAGFTSEVLFSQDNSDIEKTNVESLLAKNIKVLIVCPNDGAAAADAVEEARMAGVKVIAYDRLIMNTSAVDFYVTFDNFSVGQTQGQYLIDHATGSGNPLYLYAGSVTDNNAFQFFEGTWNVLQPKIADGTFVIENSSAAVALKDQATLTHAEQEAIFAQIAIADWNPDTAGTLATANLAAVGEGGKGNVFILAPNDGTARSIADVFAADSGVMSYKITGQDAERDSVQYIIDGKQSMTVFKDIRTLVDDAIAAAEAFLALGTPTSTTTYNNGMIDVSADPTAIVTVDKTNVKAALIDSGYYVACDFIGLVPVCQFVFNSVTASPNPTNAASVNFTVTFSKSVTDVDFADFKLTNATLTGASITQVRGSRNTYTVTASTGTGNGSIRLDVIETASIQDLDGNYFAGPYTGGATYIIDKSSPTVLYSVRASANPTSTTSVKFTIIFSESITNLDKLGPQFDDFALTTSPSISGASIISVSGSDTTYTVTVNTGSGNGTLRLDVPNSASIVDLAGNPLASLPFTSGATYTIIKTSTFKSIAANDGWTLESSEFSNLASTKNNVGTLRVGDDAKNKQYRSLLYFDTASLPNNAVITKTTLQIKKAGETGITATLGDLVADMKKGFFGLSPLELADFNAAGAPINTAGKFSEIVDIANPNWYQLTLSPANFKYINLAGVTQFRLRFAKDDNNNKTADFISFYAGDDATDKPQLIIEYYVP
jgi:putative multiple sugar transport system substrate-binding protein